MQESKSKSKSGNKVAATRTAQATPQPTIITSADQLNNQRIFRVLDNFFDRWGASGPVETTSFLLQQFFEDDKMPVCKWNKKFVNDTMHVTIELNIALMQLYEAYSHKKEYDAVVSAKAGYNG